MTKREPAGTLGKATAFLPYHDPLGSDLQNFGPKFPLGPDFYRAAAMPTQYRVIDLASSAIDPDERIVQSTSPERAVLEVIGVEVVRSGSKRDLRASVLAAPRPAHIYGPLLFEGGTAVPRLSLLGRGCHLLGT